MKIIAMYLPQFYKVKENDEWWGEGFTDWVTAKNAKPLFKGHYQPHIPMNHNFYNLMDKHTMQWQADLMKKYEVDGLCFYHYWFKDGRKILEKPAENLLHWKEIHMPFCFSWANETWARSWGQIQGANAWADAYEPEQKAGEPTILLRQSYGEKEQWKAHFDYLLPFFQDERYIKLNGKPLFLIHKTNVIPCLGEMIGYWNQLAKEAGWDGLFVIGSSCNSLTFNTLDAELFQEPGRSKRNLQEENLGDKECVLSYDDLWNRILRAEPNHSHTFFGGFVGYDDTPRRGDKGIVIDDCTPDKFGSYLIELMAKNAAFNNDITFVNAWNEWGEGMHLEPDEKYGTAFLEQIPVAKKRYMERIPYYKDKQKTDENALRELQNRNDKFEKYVNLLDCWMDLREKGISLKRYMQEHGYNKIALYGYGILGRHFLQELKGSQFEVAFIIDQQGSKLNADVPIYLPSEQFPEADVIVVSPVFSFEDIKIKLKGRNFNIVSLETILREVQAGQI